jgi:K(+)-stimulated pyrophosphate-energized sodium pump
MTAGDDANRPLSIAIAAVAAAIIVGAVWNSKRRSAVIGDDDVESAEPAYNNA